MSAHVGLFVLLPTVLSALLVGYFPVIYAVAVTFSAFYATILFCVIFYRLGPFHPLARYPGPIACKLSKFWMAYVAKKGIQHLYIQNLHGKYGDIVRIGTSCDIYPGSLVLTKNHH